MIDHQPIPLYDQDKEKPVSSPNTLRRRVGAGVVAVAAAVTLGVLGANALGHDSDKMGPPPAAPGEIPEDAPYADLPDVRMGGQEIPPEGE